MDYGKFCLKNFPFLISKDESINEGVLGLAPIKNEFSYIRALKKYWLIRSAIVGINFENPLDSKT